MFRRDSGPNPIERAYRKRMKDRSCYACTFVERQATHKCSRCGALCLRHASLHIDDHPGHTVTLVDVTLGSWMIGSDGSFRAFSTPEVDVVADSDPSSQQDGEVVAIETQGAAVPQSEMAADVPKLSDAPKPADAVGPKPADDVQPNLPTKLVKLVRAYVIKFGGEPGAKLPPHPPKSRLRAQLVNAFCGSFISIGLMAILHHHIFNPMEKSMLIANFGASAMIVFLGYDTTFAQPRNVVLGTCASAAVGMTISKLLISDSDNGGFDDIEFPVLAAALAVALTVVVQVLLRIVHPPGGAAALIPCLLPAVRDGLGWWYIVTPVLPGTIILVLCAAILNNMSPYRQYPKYWLWGAGKLQ